MAFRVLDGGPSEPTPITQTQEPSPPTAGRFRLLEGGVTDLARGVSSMLLNAPLALHTGLQRELVRLGTSPTLQPYAPALGEMVRQPIHLLGFPTEVTAGFAPGTQLGRATQAFERRATESLLPSVGETMLTAGLREAPTVARRLGGMLRELPAVRRVEETIQAARPITVEEAEQVVRSGNPPPGFAKRVARSLSIEQRQQLARRLGQVQPVPLDQPRLALPAPPSESLPPTASVELPLAAGLRGEVHGPGAGERATPGSQAPGHGGVLPGSRPTGQGQPLASSVSTVAPQSLTQLRIIRQRAIALVTRQLQEQARFMVSERQRLIRAIRESGGIDPLKGGHIPGEIRANVPRFLLRRGGMAIDELAEVLKGHGFPVEQSNDLMELLSSLRGVQPPTFGSLRAQATQIVDSEAGHRILDVLQTKGATEQATRRIVSDLTRQIQAQLRLTSTQTQRLLRAAEQRSLRPGQLARLARTQREAPGETVAGPRGGQQEAPLSPADVSQVEQRIGQVVPPRGPHVTGTPPEIPTSRSLSTYVAPGTFRDLTEFQAASLSGLEPYRAFAMIDRHRRGLATMGIYKPTLAVTRQKADEEQRILERFTRLVPGVRANTPEDTAIMALGENKIDPSKITPRLLRAAAEMRETYDSVLARVNAVRVRDGKLPIPARTDYMPHLRVQNLLAEVFGGFDKIPDDAVNLSMGEIHPNSPYAWFQNRREGGPYATSAVTAYQAWVSKALESIYYPEVLQTVRPRIQNLPPRAREYATAYVDQVLAGRPHPTDLIPPPTLLRWIDQQRARTSHGAVSGNLLSFFNQILTMPATVSSAGPVQTTRAVLALSGNAVGRFLNDLSANVGLQTTAEALLKSHQPDVINFIEQHSPLIRYRTYDVDFNVKPTAGGKLNPFAAIATAQNAFDVGMVYVAWYANYLKAARSGIGQTAAIRAAEDAATATNGNFERAALAPAYRSRVAKSVTQFTVSINNVLNYLRFDAGIQPSQLLPKGTRARFNANPRANPNWLKQGLYFMGTAMALNALIDALKAPVKKTGASDILPGIGALQGQVPATYALPVAIGQRLLAKQPQDIGKANAAIWRASWLQVPYGNQIRKTIEGLMAVAAGGSMTAKGRMRFPVQGAAEQARAIAFGPYGTEQGQAYLQRGFKPEPLTEKQKLLNRAIRNYKRSLR